MYRKWIGIWQWSPCTCHTSFALFHDSLLAVDSISCCTESPGLASDRVDILIDSLALLLATSDIVAMSRRHGNNEARIKRAGNRWRSIYSAFVDGHFTFNSRHPVSLSNCWCVQYCVELRMLRHRVQYPFKLIMLAWLWVMNAQYDQRYSYRTESIKTSKKTFEKEFMIRN